MNDNNNEAPLPEEEQAIIDAVFRLYEITILHRLHKRSKGRHMITNGAEEAAKEVLAKLKPSESVANPCRVAAHLAKNADIAEQSVRAVIASCEKFKRRLWVAIRNVDLDQDDIDTLNDDALIFKLYRDVLKMDRIIRELGREDTVKRIAHITSKLADLASKELASSAPEGSSSAKEAA